jgi:RNA polymerase sigma-70 factor (ECF subfamily)
MPPSTQTVNKMANPLPQRTTNPDSTAARTDPVIRVRSLAEPTDHAWRSTLRQARSGSLEAKRKLIDPLRAYLTSVASNVVKQPFRRKEGISDVVQISLIDAYESIGSFQGGNHREFAGWMRRILLNNVQDLMLRYQASSRDVFREVPIRRDVEEYHSVAGTDTSSPSGHHLLREEHKHLAAALRRLKPAYRQIIEMRHFKSCTFDEIGQILGVDARSARRTWKRAIRSLTRHFQRIRRRLR